MTITLLQVDGDPTNGPKYTAQQFRQGQAATHGGGSGRQLGGRSGFRLGTPSTVLSATSTTWTLNACAAMIDPGASTHQGMYGWASDANVTGAVTAADATNPRKDIVYIQVNDSSAGDGSGALTADVLYLAGTPAVDPAAPALPARSFLVGTISVPVSGGGDPSVVLNPARYVAAGADLPVAGTVERDALPGKFDGLTVRRMDLPGRPVETWDGAKWATAPHIEFTYSTALGAIPNGDAWGPMALTLDSGAVTTDSTLATHPAADKLTIAKAGTYAIWFGGAFGVTLTGTSWFQIKNDADTEVYASAPANEFWGSVSIPNFQVTADNTTLWFRLKQTSGGTNNSSGRIRITRIG